MIPAHPHSDREPPGRHPLIYLAHLIPCLWLFGPMLVGARALYFRDLSSQYAPDFEFLARSLRLGVWPLWNPTVDGGGPWLAAYPVDLLLAWWGGSRGPLSIGIALHLLLAMCGASLLGRKLGLGAWGAWGVGAVYGLSGFLLSTVNVLPLFEGAAWAPWVLVALLRLAANPSGRGAAVLGVAAFLQASTLAGEIVLQTALAALFLLPRGFWRSGPALRRLLAAGAVAGLLGAPILLGLRTLLSGSARAAGFSSATALGYSAGPVVLAEAWLPHMFGDVHAFSDLGFWGQPFFPQGYPYLLSLYLGPSVLLLAAQARERLRLVALAGLGLLLSLGHYLPLSGILGRAMGPFRGPVKFFFLSTLALALLAGLGLDRARNAAWRRLPRLALLLPGLALLLAAVAVGRAPDLPGQLLGSLVPELREPRALVVAHRWPLDALASGALCLGVGLGLGAGRGWVRASAILAILDLLIVNSALNPSTEPAFYQLRPEVKSLVTAAASEGAYRWFSYGVANSAPLHWKPETTLRGSDVWLYYMDRQSLLPRTPELDGLEGIFDEDRTGWAPSGSTLSVGELSPFLYRRQHPRFRLANVRWVFSFHLLPADLVSLKGQTTFPEIQEPLGLYEVRDPLPRAFFVARCEASLDRGAVEEGALRSDFDPRRSVWLEGPPAACASAATTIDTQPSPVVYERLDPHAVRIHAVSPPGYVVVLDFFHPDWRAEGPEGPVPLFRADGRYWAIPTPGGDWTATVTYRPPWRAPALALALGGLLLTLFLLRGRRPGSPASPGELDSAQPAR